MLRSVSQRGAKREALKLIERLPATSSWEEILYELYVLKKIEQGFSAATKGQTIPHETLKKRFGR